MQISFVVSETKEDFQSSFDYLTHLPLELDQFLQSKFGWWVLMMSAKPIYTLALLPKFLMVGYIKDSIFNSSPTFSNLFLF